MKKIDHEKLTIRDKTTRRGHEDDEYPSIGSHADKKRYFESKGDNKNKERKPSQIISNEKPIPRTIVISDKNKQRIDVYFRNGRKILVMNKKAS